jgi:hypothetical protein
MLMNVTSTAMGIRLGEIAARLRSTNDHHAQTPMPSQNRGVHGHSLEPVVGGSLSQGAVPIA